MSNKRRVWRESSLVSDQFDEQVLEGTMHQGLALCGTTTGSLADRWDYSALYDKTMKLVTLILGIVGNVLKITGNLDRSCGSWGGRGGGIFQYGRHSDFKDCYWKNEAKLTWYSVELSF